MSLRTRFVAMTTPRSQRELSRLATLKPQIGVIERNRLQMRGMPPVDNKSECFRRLGAALHDPRAPLVDSEGWGPPVQDQL
jgi:hypothetical protein